MSSIGGRTMTIGSSGRVAITSSLGGRKSMIPSLAWLTNALPMAFDINPTSSRVRASKVSTPRRVFARVGELECCRKSRSSGGTHPPHVNEPHAANTSVIILRNMAWSFLYGFSLPLCRSFPASTRPSGITVASPCSSPSVGGTHSGELIFPEMNGSGPKLAELQAAERWCEIRIGELLGKGKPGPQKKSSPAGEDSELPPRNDRYKLRNSRHPHTVSCSTTAGPISDQASMT
jgi:hypothetical protein